MKLKQYVLFDDIDTQKIKEINNISDKTQRETAFLNYVRNDLQDWLNGGKFASNLPAFRLRIQTMPGVQFNINASLDWVTVGYDGVYELDLGSMNPLINGIRFSTTSLKNLIKNYSQVNAITNEGILIEIFYEGGYA